MMYQLGHYNTKDDLSRQSKEIRDHLLSNQDFNSILELIDRYEKLEPESILILNKAINAGYWNSNYGLNWDTKQEVQFWMKVYDKSKEQIISKLQLVRTLQISGQKTINDLKDDYIEILKVQPSLYYELITEDLNEIWNLDKGLKIACLNAMFICISGDMSLIEFDEEVESQLQKHFKNEDVPIEIQEALNQIRKEKSR